jgi:hypothetical protein
LAVVISGLTNRCAGFDINGYRVLDEIAGLVAESPPAAVAEV